MIKNNGIINYGNRNINILNSEINYNEILKEITILSKNCQDDLSNLKEAVKEKDDKKIKKFIKALKKGTIALISGLGLTALERLIEMVIFN